MAYHDIHWHLRADHDLFHCGSRAEQSRRLQMKKKNLISTWSASELLTEQILVWSSE